MPSSHDLVEFADAIDVVASTTSDRVCKSELLAISCSMRARAGVLGVGGVARTASAGAASRIRRGDVVARYAVSDEDTEGAEALPTTDEVYMVLRHLRRSRSLVVITPHGEERVFPVCEVTHHWSGESASRLPIRWRFRPR